MLIRIAYTLLLALLVPIMMLRLLWRSIKNPIYRQGLSQRLGLYTKPKSNIELWIHAVSVGEVIAAKNIIEQLLTHAGKGSILVTTTTPTGKETVQRLFGSKVEHRYFPYDLPILVHRSLAKINPKAFVVIETEIWPNFWHQCKKQSIPIILANARLSDRSTHRYLNIKHLIAPTLSCAHLIACRSKKDVTNFLEIGALPSSIKLIGDIKYDLYIDDKYRLLSNRLSEQWGEKRTVLVAASTHETEDEIILQHYQHLKEHLPQLLLIIVPRHPERFQRVYQLIKETGFVAQRRSDNQTFTPATEIILGDTMGEMFAWYLSADLVFMGGSLVKTGGHNPLEPAACSKAVISASYIFNFPDAFKRLQHAGAAIVTENNDDLEATLHQILSDKSVMQEMGKKGKKVIGEQGGATQRLVAKIIESADISENSRI